MSSDSSDDEDLDKFREAADSQFINDAMFTKKKEKDPIKKSPEKLPSLRPSLVDEDEQFNSFRVTPEFRNHVAKRLSSMLDESLKYKNGQENCDNDNKSKKRKSGVRLFKNSPHCIKLKSNDPPPPPSVRIKRPKFVSDPDDIESFKSVAVTSEDILSKKETKHWSNRSKAPVYNYMKTKNGLILK